MCSQFTDKLNCLTDNIRSSSLSCLVAVVLFGCHCKSISKEIKEEQERPMEKLWFVDKREVCKTCKIRVDTRDMGLECKNQHKVFEKKHSPFSWICKECKEINFVAKFERVEEQ